MDEQREEAHASPPSLNGGPGPRTRRFVRWTLVHGRWLWLVALALALPSTVALVRLYASLTSEIEELLPRSAASVSAVDELRQRLRDANAETQPVRIPQQRDKPCRLEGVFGL